MGGAGENGKAERWRKGDENTEKWSTKDTGREQQSPGLHKHTHERDHTLNKGHSHQKEGTQSQKNSGKVKRHPFVGQYSIL